MKRTVNLRDMSATRAPPKPANPQESQTRKIMLGLQQEKKRLRMLNQNGSNQVNLPPKQQLKPVVQPNRSPPTEVGHHISPTQRNALQMANSTSFGYFIPQASSFGNIILPVIPRIGPNQAVSH
ncbi:SOSS complex subunit C [Ciona intestinalis]